MAPEIDGRKAGKANVVYVQNTCKGINTFFIFGHILIVNVS